MADENYLYLQNQNNKISNSSQPEKIEKKDLKGNNKLLPIFNYFDTDGSGVLEAKNQNGQNELQYIWQAIQENATRCLPEIEVATKDFFEFSGLILKSENTEAPTAVEQADNQPTEVNQTNSQRKKPTQEELDAFKKTIIEMKNPDGTPRFKEQLHIDALMELSTKVDLDLINKFVTHKDRTGNYTFNIDDIVSVCCPLMGRENIPELASSLSQIIETRPELLKLPQKTSGIEFQYLADALESNKDLVFKYMNMEDCSPIGFSIWDSKNYKFNSLKEILMLAEASKTDEQMVDRLIDRVVSPSGIGIIVACTSQNKPLINMLSKFYYFPSEQIESKKVDSEFVNNLIDLKSPNGMFYLIADDLVKAVWEPDICKKCLELKNLDGSLKLNSKQTVAILKLAQTNKPLAERLLNGNTPLRNDEIEQASKANNNYEIPTLSYWGLIHGDNINEELNEYPELRKEIFSKIPTGEVGEINGKLYCNAGGRLVEIKMERETFERLFPRDQILNIQQGDIGDCWLISTIGNYMRNPETRHYIYQMFEECAGSGDIVVRFSDSKVVVPFEDGEPYDGPWYRSGPPLVGLKRAPDGIRMLEQAFAVRASKSDAAVGEYHQWYDFHRCIEIENNIDSMMTTLNGNTMSRALRPIAGKNADIDGYLLTDNGYKHGSIMHTVDMVRIAFKGYSGHDYTLDKDKVLNEIMTRLEDKNTLVMIGTKNLGYTETAMDDNVMLSLCGPHAYYVVDVDKENGLIYIANPWDNAEVKAMPIDLFMNELCAVSFAKLK